MFSEAEDPLTLPQAFPYPAEPPRQVVHMDPCQPALFQPVTGRPGHCPLSQPNMKQILLFTSFTSLFLHSV